MTAGDKQNLRTSSYTIYVDLPDDPDHVLLVHGYTGAYDRVARHVADYLLALETEPAPKPLYGEWVSDPSARPKNEHTREPSDETIAILKRRGYLTTKTADQEVGYLARLVKHMHARAGQNMPSYLFMPTYDCNLRCSYCFQDHMRTDARFRHLLRTMSPEMVDRIMLALPTIEESRGIPKNGKVPRRIGFFGGEPLLAANRPIVEYIMTAARKLGPATFWAVTNATELDAYEDLLGPHGIDYVQITFDGPPEEHDRRRIYPDGSGSFERIAANIDLCLAKGVRVTTRMNIDRENVNQLPALAREIVRRGWNQHAHFATYTAPIHPSTPAEFAQLKSRYFTSWELDEAIDALRAIHPEMRVIGRPDDWMHVRARSVFEKRSDPRPYFKSGFCGAHSSMYLFDAFGDMYACWEQTGDPSIRIGRVLENGEVEMNEPMNRLWRTRTAASNPTCRRCRYALHCGGGCTVLAFRTNGKYHSNYCDAFGERFRHAIATAYQEFVQGGTTVGQEPLCAV